MRRPLCMVTSLGGYRARLLQRVFALDMVTCPFCCQGSLRIIAVITQVELIRKILRHVSDVIKL